MFHRWHAPLAPIVLAAIILLADLPSASLAQPRREKIVSNYDGGVFLLTEGGIPNGPCFYVSGRVTAPNFFDRLKRIDDDKGTFFRRGSESVTRFPDRLLLSFVIYDMPCSDTLQQASTRTYLTRVQVDSLGFSIYWKRGVELRRIANVVPLHSAVKSVAPYAAALADALPERFEWFYVFGVPSAGVPLTDSLVLIIHTPDNRLAARVAARL